MSVMSHRRPMTAYAELQVTSNFSFLRGGSHPEELVLRAAELGLSAIALTDRNTLAGVVRAHVAAKEVGIRFVVGARLDLMPGKRHVRFLRCRVVTGRLRVSKAVGWVKRSGTRRSYVSRRKAHAWGLTATLEFAFGSPDLRSVLPRSPPGLTAEGRIPMCRTGQFGMTDWTHRVKPGDDSEVSGAGRK